MSSHTLASPVMDRILLPGADGRLAPFALSPARRFPAARPPFPRIALAAAHMVVDPLVPQDPWDAQAIDWD
ncbi:DUF993 family protein, partial [Teichococcus deserti]|uniref:DUF993 family protein n=1 Tax=Teichococcus deserti TaxID=1817963 RepID=UPI001F61F14C